MRKFFVLLTLLVILSSMALFCWYYLKSISPNQTNSYIETIKIKYEPSYHFSGIQSPSQITKLLLETDKGYIHNWFIKNNDTVKKHQPLFEYYNPNTERLIANKQKYLSHLKQKKPRSQSIISNEISRTQSEIESLQSTLRTVIYAPFDGNIHINQNFPTKDKELILQIFNSNAIIKSVVSESLIAQLHENDKVLLKDDSQQSFTGKITYISKLPRQFDPAAKYSQYNVEISTNSEALYGRHYNIEKPNKKIVIPKSAIYNDKFVFLQRNKKFIKRVIKAQNMGNGKDVLILEGLKQGDIIARNVDTVPSKN
ncbi:efflux RND transporter periplasmic adaptor subunit [Staphylococcus pseudoxylosus]|uniref:efflux RND transporter periplasmic adaptor subunit n=1 Tax=Staphylococcus pseudoxylosus TaxID=2282419 RepID=UPI002DBA43D6|nr:efflux RND transporter periplasmic adaptor subunit [Staphylococcus pseudoxylosus]MEB8008527.1 efflux RND transporter periplasmic adaptor subunit [Staphylococcus pseudoxylosus]